MLKRKINFLYMFLTLALVLACVPTFAAPLPTADPNAINTFIAQTANAASTQTAAAQPTLTHTPTVTPTRPTDTPSPTATATVIFILSTPTQTVSPTSTFVISGGGGGVTATSSANYSCQVISVSPANGTSFDPRDDFDVTWRVRNNGQRTWDRNSVDFIYDSGDKIHKVDGYDLSANVASGNTTNLGADILAPRNSGTYTTTWTLRVGNEEFCKMSFTMRVR